MIKQVIYSRSAQEITAVDDGGEILGSWECRDDFVEGYNDEGLPRESLPNGIYDEIDAEVYYPGEQPQMYGTFYITTGDYRGRDIHGGGSGLPDPYAPYQGWVPTWGCLRMQNADGEELSNLITEANDAGQEVALIVGE